MTYSEWSIAYFRARKEHPEWRAGQCAFNVLYDLNPELANEIRGSDMDPFYKSDGLPLLQFADWLFNRLNPDCYWAK